MPGQAVGRHAIAAPINKHVPTPLADHAHHLIRVVMEDPSGLAELSKVGVRTEIKVHGTLEAELSHHAHALSITSWPQVASAQLEPEALSIRRRAFNLMTASSE